MRKKRGGGLKFPEAQWEIADENKFKEFVD